MEELVFLPYPFGGHVPCSEGHGAWLYCGEDSLLFSCYVGIKVPCKDVCMLWRELALLFNGLEKPLRVFSPWTDIHPGYV